MAKKVGICPACEQHVEWQQMPSATGTLLYKCSNCWHHIDGFAFDVLDKLNDDLLDLEKKRKALLEAAL